MSKTNIPAKVVDIIKELGMTRDETLWDCHGTWVMYHKALEKIAAHKGVTFDDPKIIHSDMALKSVVVLVTGRMDKRSEWSFGEATPANNKNAYPFAMSEKRAKDRVILKLVGLHGDVYSDTEIDKQAQDDIKARVTKKKPLIEVTTTEEIKTEDPPKDQEKKDPAPVTLEEKIEMTQQDRLDIWETWANRQIDEFQKKPTQSALLSWVQGHIRKDLGALKEIDTRLYNQVNEAYSRRLNEIIEKQEG
tara:strand:- start:1934 stop:2677 length:744 start_codon:yes stop_codon:yes gene_type:complete